MSGCERERLGAETGNETAGKRVTHCWQIGPGKESHISETGDSTSRSLGTGA